MPPSQWLGGIFVYEYRSQSGECVAVAFSHVVTTRDITNTETLLSYIADAGLLFAVNRVRFAIGRLCRLRRSLLSHPEPNPSCPSLDQTLTLSISSVPSPSLE